MWVIFRQNYVNFIQFSIIHPLIRAVSLSILGRC